MASKKITRRSLLAGGAAAAGVAVTGGPTPLATAAEQKPDPAEKVEPAIVVAVSESLLTLEMRDGVKQELTDPKPRDQWVPGHEADVIWFFEEGEWVLFDIQRMYRPLGEAEVTGREGDLLETTREEMAITDETEAREFFEAGRIIARKPQDIDSGNTVVGIGHRDPSGTKLEVDQIGVRQG